jgi:hypothetical protein
VTVGPPSAIQDEDNVFELLFGTCLRDRLNRNGLLNIDPYNQAAIYPLNVGQLRRQFQICARAKHRQREWDLFHELVVISPAVLRIEKPLKLDVSFRLSVAPTRPI